MKLLIPFFFILNNAYCQFYDNNLVVFDDVGRLSTIKNYYLFDQLNNEFTLVDSLKLFDNLVNLCISDQLGNPAFITDGLRVYDSDMVLYNNGDSLSYDSLLYEWKQLNKQGRFEPNSFQCINFPENSMKYFLFYIGEYILESGERNSRPILYSVINTESKNLEVKDSLLISKPSYIPYFIKHGAKEEWWMITSMINSNEHYIHRIDSSGIQFDHIDTTGHSIYNNLSITRGDPSNLELSSSSDGTKFIKLEFNGRMHIYDFNRCDGILFFDTLIQTSITNNADFPDLSVLGSNGDDILYGDENQVHRFQISDFNDELLMTGNNIAALVKSIYGDYFVSELNFDEMDVINKIKYDVFSNFYYQFPALEIPSGAQLSSHVFPDFRMQKIGCND